MWYWILRAALLAIARAYFRIRITGLENIPAKTNFVIVSNHVSFLDPLMIMAVVPRKIYCIALRDLYRIGWMKWFLVMTETLPSGSASERAIRLLLKNKNVGLFPEGGVSRDGKLQEFRRGAALLAFRTGRPIVPCAVSGTFESLPFGARIPRRRQITLAIGKPIYLLKEFEHHIEDPFLQEGTLRVRNAVKEMIHEPQ